MAKYLDEVGTQRLWGKVKAYVAAHAGGGGGLQIIKIIHFINQPRVSGDKLTVDLSSAYPEYAELTMDDLLVRIDTYVIPTNSSSKKCTVTYSYEPNTGQLTIDTTQTMWSSTPSNNNVTVFILQGDRQEVTIS